jgi:hypothetical protein
MRENGIGAKIENVRRAGKRKKLGPRDRKRNCDRGSTIEG